MAQIEISVPAWIVKVARVQDNGDKEPNYGGWTDEPRLDVVDVFKGSSVVGHSYAKLRVVSGQPGTIQVDVENAGSILSLGDRVAIGINYGGGNVSWQFCGYCATAQIAIDGDSETLGYRIAGPEWILGSTEPAGGTNYVIRGAARRTYTGDDAWIKDQATITAYKDWDIFTDELPILNPQGRKNMTTKDVVLSKPKVKPQVKGRLWEIPNRRFKKGTDDPKDIAAFWDMLNAAKLVVTTFSEPAFSGIVVDWTNVPFSDKDILNETNLFGLGTWAALQKIVAPKYSFFVDPVPKDPSGNHSVGVSGSSWGPFNLVFFSRADGRPANLYLNPRGTLMAQAKASITRLQAAKDISKTVTQAAVRGTNIRTIRLVYWGGHTNGLTAKQKQTALQNGWSDDEDKIANYEGVTAHVVTATTIDAKNAAARTKWLNRYNASGKDFLKYSHIFRRFLWNEANELDVTKKTTYATHPLNWFAPDLTGIADTPDYPKKWMRRQRKLLDTIYLSKDKENSWQRIRPALWMSVAKNADDKDFNSWKWRRIADSYFSFDPFRAEIDFKVDDLAEWRPFDKQDKIPLEEGTDPSDPPPAFPNDDSTFATLLNNGMLRMCIEASIYPDNALEHVSLKDGSAGSPFVREVVVDARNTFVKTLTWNDGLTSPSGLTPATVDNSADQNRQADAIRDAAKFEVVHSSILVAADWEEQYIGYTVGQTKGRAVSLSDSGGKGAQIVAIRYDVKGMKVEYLTESIALSLLEKDRRELTRHREYHIEKHARTI